MLFGAWTISSLGHYESNFLLTFKPRLWTTIHVFIYDTTFKHSFVGTEHCPSIADIALGVIIFGRFITMKRLQQNVKVNLIVAKFWMVSYTLLYLLQAIMPTVPLNLQTRGEGGGGSADSMKPWPCSRHKDVNFATLSKRKCCNFLPCSRLDQTLPYSKQYNDTEVCVFTHFNEGTGISENYVFEGGRHGEDLQWQPCSKHKNVKLYTLFNPFTPESDQCQNSPAASQEIWHHTVWRTWLFIAYSDEKWLYYKFLLHHSYNRFLKGWENTLFELRSERVKTEDPENDILMGGTSPPPRSPTPPPPLPQNAAVLIFIQHLCMFLFHSDMSTKFKMSKWWSR